VMTKLSLHMKTGSIENEIMIEKKTMRNKIELSPRDPVHEVLVGALVLR